jgi:hypothetical protein
VKVHSHSTITAKAILAAQHKADKFADSRVRCRVRLAAIGDAHPNLLGCHDEKQLLDIMDAFPVDVLTPGPTGSMRTETIQVEDVLKVVKLFLSATGQNLLASNIKPRSKSGIAGAAGASSSPGTSSFCASISATSLALRHAMPQQRKLEGKSAPGTVRVWATAARSAALPTASPNLLPATSNRSQWRSSPAVEHGPLGAARSVAAPASLKPPLLGGVGSITM